MRALAIMRLALLRMLRDRTNLFFVFVFPLALVLLIGLQFGGSQERTLAVVAPADPAADTLVADLGALEGVVVERHDTRAEAVEAVARGRAQAALVLTADYGAALEAGDARAELVVRPGGAGEQLRPVVAGAVGEQGIAAAALAVATSVTDLPPDRLADAVGAAAGTVSAVDVAEVTVAGDPLAEEFSGLGQFELGATSQLVLFVFITTLTTASALVQDRHLGMVTRMSATPTRAREIVLGTALGRFGVALFQGLYIMVGALLIFGVDWGSPLGALAVLVAFAAVSAGAGLLLGALARNDAQVGGWGIGLGLGLAALGGSMAPLEVFPETMQRVALLTPHAWANRAFADLVRRDAGVGAVLPELAVLVGIAAVLLALATSRLRAVTVRG